MPGLPFNPLAQTADPRRYVPLDTAERALAGLAQHLREYRSPVLLTGPSGMGKTLLLHVLAERERGWAQRVRLSTSLDRSPDELAGWLLHYLFGSSAPERDDVEVALVERIRSAGRDRMLLLVDQIHHAPRDSVRKLAELARAGKPELTVVVAGVDGADLRERLADLAPEACVALPDSLPDGEIEALYDAILADPGLSPRLHSRLQHVARSEIVRTAAGLPLLLKQELLRREEARGLLPGPSLVGVVAPESPAVAAAFAEPAPEPDPYERRYDPPRVRVLRAALRVRGDALLGRSRRMRARLAEVVPGAARAMRPRLEHGARAAGERYSAMRAAAAEARGESMQLARSARAELVSAHVAMGRVRARIAASLHGASSASRRAAALLLREARERFERGRRTAAALREDLNAQRTSAQARLAERSRQAFEVTRRTSAARLAGLRAAEVSLAHAARSATREGAVTLAAVRRAMRVAAPRAAVPVTALLALVLLHPGDPDTARREVPAISSLARELEVVAPRPVATVGSTAQPVNLQVNARPWARVRIDGRDVGPTPLSQRLAPGMYQLEARFPDGRTIRRDIEVSSESRFISLP